MASVRGVIGEDGLKQYHGIPFAAPPIGDLRWATHGTPCALGRRAGCHGGWAFGACSRRDRAASSMAETGFEMDEDCLTVNVWTRAEHEGDALPVMVWIHGGALVTGGPRRSVPGRVASRRRVWCW